jgi:tRNA dimethylallyltransferase
LSYNYPVEHLIAIVGPTGSGKSDLAVRLAQTFGGEIVSADSRQLIRYLDIGTAKPLSDERGGVPHHLFDIINPDTDCNLADYQQLAYQTINVIQSYGRLPFLVGGSGQYAWAVLEGWQIPRVPPDRALRRVLEDRARTEGGESLYRQLQQLDIAAAELIDPRNIRRVIRALELRLGGGKELALSPSKRPPPYRILVIGLTAERSALYRRIDLRVDKMIENGLVDEVRSVLNRGFAPDAPGLQSVGYKDVVSHLKGELDLAEMADRIKAETHRLVRHQYAWFRPNDRRIRWLDVATDYITEAKELVTTFLNEKSVQHGFY